MGIACRLAKGFETSSELARTPEARIVSVESCGVHCAFTPPMETIQIVLEKKLLQAADGAARRTKRNRSALIREALREHFWGLEVRAREERDRAGYSQRPQVQDESHLWEVEGRGRQNCPRRCPPLQLCSA